MKTSLKEKKLVYKNGKYPILNQDTEGFEITDNSQIAQVNKKLTKIQEYIYMIEYIVLLFI